MNSMGGGAVKIARNGCMVLLPVCWLSYADNIQEVDRLVRVHHEEVDVGLVSLLLARDIDSTIAVQKYLLLLDKLAASTHELSNGSEHPSHRGGALNSLLFQEGPWNEVAPGKHIIYKYDTESTLKARLDALFMGELLGKQKGSCATLPTLWYSIADRLRWPVKVVRLPGHFFVRYQAGDSAWNIEATANGSLASTARYIEDFQIPEKAIENGIYLRPLSKKQFISSLLVNNAYFHFESNNKVKAVEVLRLALNYDSINVAAVYNLGKILGDSALVQKAWDMGFVNRKSERYERRLQEIYIRERDKK